MPALAAIDREAHPIVVRHDHSFAVAGVDPHVVVVADRRDGAGQIDARLPAVDGLRELCGKEECLVLVVRRHGEARVVVRPAAQAAVGAHHRPVLAAVLAAPQRSALRFLTVVGQHAVAGFDERVDAVRVAARDLAPKSCRAVRLAGRVRRSRPAPAPAVSRSRRRRST
jgi:hypothetical protein